jgi:ubiquitin carboxyl-terminal hydrolase 10
MVLIETLPPVLVIHLKRFSYKTAGGAVKTSNHVQFSPELEIPPGTHVIHRTHNI